MSLEQIKGPRRAVATGSVLLSAIYVLAALTQKSSIGLTIFGDFAQLALAVLLTAAFVGHVPTTHGRQRSFWVLMTIGASFWMASQASWTYWEVFKRVEVPNAAALDIVLFLHLVPMMAALATLPHNPKRMAPMIPFSLAMLAVWWMYLYSFVVIPWQYVLPNLDFYGPSFNILYSTEDIAFIVALGALVWRSSGQWRLLYRRLLISSICYTISAHITNTAIDAKRYYTGCIYDIPVILSVAYMCWAAAVATPENTATGDVAAIEDPIYSDWTSKFAITGLLSVPVLAVWCLEARRTPAEVQHFRILVSLGAILLLTALLFALQHVLSWKLRRSLVAVKESLSELALARETLEHQATHDLMTGVMNRTTVVMALERELARAERSRSQIAIMLIDLDFFKQINDSLGHHAGDVAIIACCTRMQDCLRPSDYVGRYGGEEFLVIVPECDKGDALQIAERIRARISAVPITFNGKPIHVTASIGVAVSSSSETSEAMLQRADMALYAGKQTGRNTVQMSRPEPEVFPLTARQGL